MKQKPFVLQMLLLLFLVTSLSAGNEAIWNGYIQTRFQSDLDQRSGFLIRRGKLWLKGPLPQFSFLNFKFQVVYRSHKDQSFLMQDAYIEYQQKNLRFKAGRFVPDFTLEWNQPDAVIPLMERGLVIKALMHGENSTARQIGFQATYFTKYFSGSAGFFNAEQEVPGENKHSDLLYTSRISGQLPITPGWSLHLGGSFAYRYLHGSVLKNIAGTQRLFTGNDLRYGLELLFKTPLADFQAEWLKAKISDEKTQGAYLFINLHPNSKFEIVPFLDWFEDLRSETSDHPWYGLDISYHFQKQNKIMAEYKWQSENGQLSHYAALQLQIFIHS